MSHNYRVETDVGTSTENHINATLSKNYNKLHLYGFSLAAAMGLVLCWMSNFDLAAEEYLAELMAANLLVYGTARVINALISVIQSVEISLSLGAGIAVNLGEALDPLNDLIERFSGFVLYGLAGLGLQQIVLTASTSIVTKLATSVLIISGLLFWLRTGRIATWHKKLIIIFVLARFAFVAEVGLAWSLDKMYFNDQQESAVLALNNTQRKLQKIRESYVNAAADTNIFSNVWESARDVMGDKDQEGVADIAAGAIVQLIVILFLRSILLPAFFFWLLIQLVRKL
ncbi:MAG: hypothetical protein ACJAVI_003493 [Candidatus Azotimanducaceae bacterium]|jgi:hypothetical protein